MSEFRSPRVPELGPKVPQRGSNFSRYLGHFVLSLFGWRVTGELPDRSKFIIIGAPHTSNLDGILGLAALLAMGINANTMIKDTAFFGPLGWLLRKLGAIPIDRKSPKGVVEQSIDAFNQREAMVLLLAPEGTRKQAKEFKRGFYRIADGAQVPIVPAAPNYAKKAAHLGPCLQPSGDYEADLTILLDFLRLHGRGRRPERTSLPLRDTQN